MIPGLLPSGLLNYDNRVLGFYDRPIGQGLKPFLCQVPADFVIRHLDRDLILHTEWGPNDVAFIGGLDAWEKVCFGYVLMRGDEILSEATVGPSALGCYEPGVFTQKNHRGKGYGTMVTSRLIQEIEALGKQTFWNCTIQNSASAAIARKLGTEKNFAVWPGARPATFSWKKFPTIIFTLQSIHSILSLGIYPPKSLG